MKTIIVNASLWDEGGYVVSMRPENAKPWQDVPVGPVLSEQKAKIIAEWLTTAMPDLQKLIVQTEADPSV